MMKKQQWPLRWDLLLRYRLIEIIALWEGRLTTKHLCDTFGIGRQQASKDINTYLNAVGPGNIEYDKYLKGYKPTATFKPAVTLGNADEYLQLLSRNNELTDTFDSLTLAVANTEVLSVPVRNVKPEVIRAIVQAAREKKRIEVDYVSVSSPNREGRVIVPHTLVFTGVRWHVRAWCEKNGNYRDFVLSRFRGDVDMMDSSEHTMEYDDKWNTLVTIKIKPDTRLEKAQQKVIAEDWGMTRNKLDITVRGTLVQYALQSLHIDANMVQAKAEAQQIVISNLDEIKPWLFG
jgi:predicted DNA-binding transcriptional regulator YafY